MTLPILPAALNTGDYVDDTWVDRVRAYHNYWGQERPSVGIIHTTAAPNDEMPADTTNNLGETDGDGTTVQYEIGETFYTTTGGKGARMTAPVTGIYRFGCRVNWANGSGGGQRMIGYTLNGGGSQWAQTSPGYSNSGFGQSFDIQLELDATDYIILIGRSTVTTQQSGHRRWMTLISEQ